MARANNENLDRPEEISLKDLIIKINGGRRYLRSKWKVIAIATAIGGVLGLVYSFYNKPVYEARLSFALQEDNSSGGNVSSALGLASQFGLGLGSSGGTFTANNLLELMKSRAMVENTLLTPVEINKKKQTLAEFYISFMHLRDKWRQPELKNLHFPVGQQRSTFSLKQDSVLWTLCKAITGKNLHVQKIDKTESLNEIRVGSSDELFAFFFTEILVKTVSDFYIDTKTKKSAQNVAILQHQTDSVRRELNSAITGVATSGDVNPNPNPSLQIIRVPSLHRQVDVEANTAILTELVKDLEMSKVSLRKETPLIQVIDRPILPLEKKKIGKIMGFILGGFIMCFLTISYLLSKKIFRSIMS